MAKSLNELAGELKSVIIEQQSDAHNKANLRPERYNNLKLSMDIAKDSTPHVVVTVGMSEAKYNIKMGEKMEGGLGPDDKYVQRWFNNTNTIPALMECWNTIARERDRA